MESNPHNPLQSPHAEAFRSPVRMVPAAFAVLFAAIIAVSAASQKKPTPPPPNPKAFVGSWTATFQGMPFMTVRFVMKDGKLSGAMTNGQITVDHMGNITAVSVQPGEKPLKIEKVEHNAIYMSHAGKAQNVPVRFSFRLSDKTHALLQILNTPPLGIAPLKPISLVKQTKKH